MVTAVVVGAHTYLPKSDHRDATNRKSQWTIDIGEEVEAFRLGVASEWTEGHLAWGLHLADGEANYLGTAAQDPGPPIDLFLAVFEIASLCHGYPADHRKPRQKPPTAVLGDWLSHRYVRPAVVRKIGQGKPCSL